MTIMHADGKSSEAADKSTYHFLSLDTSEDSTISKDKVLHFNATLEKNSGVKTLGVIASLDGESISIQSIKEGGLIRLYNDSVEPEHRIRPGDRIVEINGVAGDTDQMDAELQNSQVVKLRLERREVIITGQAETCAQRWVMRPLFLICSVIVLNVAGYIIVDGDYSWESFYVVYTLQGIFFLCLLLTNQLDAGKVWPDDVEYVHELKLLPENEQLTLDNDRFCIIRDVHDYDMYRWCHTCELWKPRHVSHCDHCQQCVWRFDHHCYVVGNCIGARNHKFFALMLLSGAAAFSIGLSVVYAHVLSLGAFSVLAWWPMRVQQWRLYLGLLYLVVGMWLCATLTMFAIVHSLSLVFNFNTKMCLSPNPDGQACCRQSDPRPNTFNSWADLKLLFCAPLRFRRYMRESRDQDAPSWTVVKDDDSIFQSQCGES